MEIAYISSTKKMSRDVSEKLCKLADGHIPTKKSQVFSDSPEAQFLTIVSLSFD